MAIVDMINASKIPVRTTALGDVSSCALLVLMSGQKGFRSTFPNSIFMSHQWSAEYEGKEHEIKSWISYNNEISEKMFKLYKKNLNVNDNFIKKKLLGPSDFYFFAKDAVKFGFVDKEIDNLDQFI